jgi:hypothetical protein
MAFSKNLLIPYYFFFSQLNLDWLHINVLDMNLVL